MPATRLTPAKARDKHNATFQLFWKVYPKHTNMNETAVAWGQLIESGADAQAIIRAAKSYAEGVGEDLKYVPAPHRWLAAGRYDDVDLFVDESAAQERWFQKQLRTVNVRAVEDRFHVTMPKQYPPADMTNPKAIEFWYQAQARAWISEVYRSKCPIDSQPTTPVPSKRSSEPSSTTQLSLGI